MLGTRDGRRTAHDREADAAGHAARREGDDDAGKDPAPALGQDLEAAHGVERLDEGGGERRKGRGDRVGGDDERDLVVAAELVGGVVDDGLRKRNMRRRS